MSEEEVTQPTLDTQYILANYQKLTGEQIEQILNSTSLLPALLTVISKCNENQLKQIVRRMNLDQIRTTIPKLQLQQTGACIQVMNPDQIRKAVSSFTIDDRQILKSNISLLTSCTNKDELQSFISFIDPLAMCVAVENSELCQKLIESAAAMTVDQIRVIVPLLDIYQIRDICKEVKEDSHLETIISMIDSEQKEEMIQMLEEDFSNLQTKQNLIAPRLKSIKEEEFVKFSSPLLEINSASNKQEKYNELVRHVKNLKTEIESLQRSIRDIQAFLPLPIRLLSQEKSSYGFYLQLENQLKVLAKEAYSMFLSIDKSISELSTIACQIEQTTTTMDDNNRNNHNDDDAVIQDQVCSPDSIYEDDRAILLYEAVKEIGNPDAVANIYSMTWNQIIQAGFRSADDFKRKGVASLEQLQKYIDEYSSA